MKQSLVTGFTSLERVPQENIATQSRLLADSDFIQQMLDALPQPAVIVNQQRQAVLANKVLMDWVGKKEMGGILGDRPGDLVGCIHAHETGVGCGASESCPLCGSLIAFRESQGQHGRASNECRIIAARNGATTALDLLVTVTPLRLFDEQFWIMSLADISSEKRKRSLEHIFFHDMINTAGGIQGALELLKMELDSEKAIALLTMADRSVNRLMEEIQSQRTLNLAENNELKVELNDIPSLALLKNVARFFDMHPVAVGRSIRIDPESDVVLMRTDGVLMRRVLGNLVKNALEACQPGECVTMGCRAKSGEIEFQIRNPGVIPREVQLQIFQRSFSTKGAGRGLGTYSIRLLSERYLKGQVFFTSQEDEGTVFTARYPVDLEKA